METATLDTRSARQAFRSLQVGFVIAPVVAGLDKFFDLLVNWGQYMAPFFGNIVPPNIWMPIVGVIEIAGGLLVAFRPRIGGYVVGAWLMAIVINLLVHPGSYDGEGWGLDIALRDVGLAMGALAMAGLAGALGRK